MNMLKSRNKKVCITSRRINSPRHWSGYTTTSWAKQPYKHVRDFRSGLRSNSLRRTARHTHNSVCTCASRHYNGLFIKSTHANFHFEVLSSSWTLTSVYCACNSSRISNGSLSSSDSVVCTISPLQFTVSVRAPALLCSTLLLYQLSAAKLSQAILQTTLQELQSALLLYWNFGPGTNCCLFARITLSMDNIIP